MELPVYARPQSVEEAVALLSGGAARVIAGGTDVYPACVGRALPQSLVDVTAITSLREIGENPESIRIGAGVTWSDIIGAPLPPAFDALKSAAREVGSVQIQNRGTIAGNLCNASPAADGVPALLALDATVEMTSAKGVRVLPLRSFITGYRRTALDPDELVTAILVPSPPLRAQSAFAKLGSRRYLVISIVMAAAVIARNSDGVVTHAAVAVGAASPVACRLPALEAELRGLGPDRLPSSVLRPEHLAGLSPIDDVRATAAYRNDAAVTLVAQVIDEAGAASLG